MTLATFPNPARGQVNLCLEGDLEGAFQAFIFDQSGRLVRQVTLQKEGGLLQQQINLQGIPTGLYFIRVDQADTILNGKFLLREKKRITLLLNCLMGFPGRGSPFSTGSILPVNFKGKVTPGDLGT